MSDIIAVPNGENIDVLSDRGTLIRRIYAGGEIISAPIVTRGGISVTIRTREGGRQVKEFSHSGTLRGTRYL